MADEVDESLEFYAQTYDESVPDWPGEMEFYRELAGEVQVNGGSILEVACGTGRVMIRLAQQGVNIMGFDLSNEMLNVARNKCAGMQNIRLKEGDMRSFEMGEKFELVIIPGHSFQNLNTTQEQVECLTCIKHHLVTAGRLVIHLDYPDFAWLGELVGSKRGVFEDGVIFRHPITGNMVQTKRAWWFETSTQTATFQTKWEVMDASGAVIRSIQKDKIRLHAIFPSEVENLLARAGFSVEAVYGDFYRNPLTDQSTDMIWVARTDKP